MYMEWPVGVDLDKALGDGSAYMRDPVAAKWEKGMQSFFEAGEWENMNEVYGLKASPHESTNSRRPNYEI